MQEAHVLKFEWHYTGQQPFEVIREVTPEYPLALPQLADDGFEGVIIRRAEEFRPLLQNSK